MSNNTDALWQHVIIELEALYIRRNNSAPRGTQCAYVNSDDQGMRDSSAADCEAWCDDLEARCDYDVADLRVALDAYWEEADTRVTDDDERSNGPHYRKR